jgi:hypothetical protein
MSSKGTAVRFTDHNDKVYYACDTSWKPADVKKWKGRALDNHCYDVKIVRVLITELPPTRRTR